MAWVFGIAKALAAVVLSWLDFNFDRENIFAEQSGTKSSIFDFTTVFGFRTISALWDSAGTEPKFLVLEVVIAAGAQR